MRALRTAAAAAPNATTNNNSSNNTLAYNSRWTTCGRKLLRDGKSFFVRGVNYAPTPIGHPGRLDLLNNSRVYERDLANLRGMHANAVKVSSRFTHACFAWRACAVYVCFPLTLLSLSLSLCMHAHSRRTTTTVTSTTRRSWTQRSTTTTDRSTRSSRSGSTRRS